MIKLTVLYGHPKDAQAFEAYYAATHLPLVDAIPGMARAELTRFSGTPDGAAPAYYRMAELYFPSPAQMQASMGSAEGEAAVADIGHFATGGVSVLVGEVD